MKESSLANNTALSSPEELLKVASEAAREHQPDKMLEALAASGFIDGLTRRLKGKWGRLPRIEIEECVAKAIDKVYEAITQGRSIRNLGAWLWKAADNLANDCWRDDYSHRAGGRENLENLASDNSSPPTIEERLHREELAQFRRDEAIRLARRLLPRIGQGQIIKVMELVIDAVEQGIPDLTSVDIGNALGITSNAARTLRKRGFERLRREARREGIEYPEHLALDEKQDN